MRCVTGGLEAQKKGPGHPGKRRCLDVLSNSSIDESSDEPRQRRPRTATNNSVGGDDDSPIYENDDPSSADVPQPDLVHSTPDPAPDLSADLIAEGHLPPEAPTSNVGLSRRTGSPEELRKSFENIVEKWVSEWETARGHLQTQVDDLKQEVRQKEAEAAEHQEKVRGLQADIDRLEQVEREQEETVRALQARLHHQQEVAKRNEQAIAQFIHILEGRLHDLKRNLSAQGDTMNTTDGWQRPQVAVQAS